LMKLVQRFKFAEQSKKRTRPIRPMSHLTSPPHRMRPKDIVTEMYSKWMIEPPADLAESAELSSSFHFVAEELGIEVRHDCAIQKELKFLLMNGTHACFALLAIEYGFSELTTFGHTAEGRSVLETTLDEFCVVMKARFPMFPQSELMETRSQFAKRILSHTKDVAAVLSRLKPDSYADLIADLGKKLTDPYDTLLKVSGAVSGDEFMIAHSYGQDLKEVEAELARLVGAIGGSSQDEDKPIGRRRRS